MEQKDYRVNRAALQVFLDNADGAEISGRVLGEAPGEIVVFVDLAGLAFAVDKVLEKREYPQIFERLRTFSPGKAKARGKRQNVPAVWGGEGEKPSFTITVLSRRHATWQGFIDWLDGSPEQRFASVMEFMRLVADRTEKN